MIDTIIVWGATYLWLVAPFAGLAFFIFTTREKKKELALLSIIAFPFTYIVAKLVGLFYENARPFVAGEFAPLIPHIADNGFPSDHTLIVAIFAFVVFFTNRTLGFTLLLVALAVGAFRIFAGVHHVLDIAGSIGIAIFVAYIAYYLLKRARR